MRQVLYVTAVLAGLSACVSPPVPDDSAIDYFDQSAQVERDFLLTGETPVDPQTGAALDGTAAAPTDVAAAEGAGAETQSNPGISSEQDFETVSTNRTIERDAQRIAANRELYVLIEPTELPKRPGSNQPNIVAFALQTTHPVGATLYPRSRLRSDRAHRAACGRYSSPDKAQTAFLSAGGPSRDRRNLDPDGDGFACGWDPSPFRKARGTAAAATATQPTQTAATSLTQSSVASPQPASTSAVVQPLVISSE